MQRHSSFPDGWPGIGLLLLRLAIGTTLILQGLAYLPGLHEMRLEGWAAFLLVLLSGTALLLGLLTAFAGALAVLASLGVTLLWFPAPSWNFFNGTPLSLDVIVMALAAALLGPGAFSLDAHLFGRRKVIIPPSRVPES